jgi:hypothetical protein
MFLFVLHWEPKQNQSPKRCATFSDSLITQYTRGGQSRRASGDALWEATWERTAHQYFLFLIWWLLIAVYPTPIDKFQLLFSPLRRRSTAAHLLRSWVRIPPGKCMSLCCECCVLSGRGLCDEVTTRPEESYRLWCVAVYVTETSSTRSQTSINDDWTHEISSLEGTSSR